MFYRMLCTLALGACVTPLASAQENMANADWRDMVRGFGGQPAQTSALNTTVKPQKVSVGIPSIMIAKPDEMEEVVVVGQAPEERGPLLPFELDYRWVSDYDRDYYGLLVYTDEDSDWVLRLFTDSRTGFMR